MSVTLKVMMPIRIVRRSIEHPYEGKKYYYVLERTPDGGWKHVSKGYEHSTSAFAALGRLSNKEAQPFAETYETKQEAN